MNSSLLIVALWSAAINPGDGIATGSPARSSDEAARRVQPGRSRGEGARERGRVGGQDDHAAGLAKTSEVGVRSGPANIVAPKVASALGVERRIVEKTAKADIILHSVTNNTNNAIRFETTILSGQEIFVDGNADIDEKTFQNGIKDSRKTEGQPGKDRVDLELKPGARRVIVGHYRFVLKGVEGAEGENAKPATEWVGTLAGFGILYALPDNIDHANSGPSRLIRPVD